jgi:hypothetical protein
MKKFKTIDYCMSALLDQTGFRFTYPMLEGAIRKIIETIPKKKYRLF